MRESISLTLLSFLSSSIRVYIQSRRFSIFCGFLYGFSIARRRALFPTGVMHLSRTLSRVIPEAFPLILANVLQKGSSSPHRRDGNPESCEGFYPLLASLFMGSLVSIHSTGSVCNSHGTIFPESRVITCFSTSCSVCRHKTYIFAIFCHQ